MKKRFKGQLNSLLYNSLLKGSKKHKNILKYVVT